MKKIVLLALLLLSGVTASAQYYEEDYVDPSYDYVVESNLDLTGEQWHLAGTSILAAANNLYLIIDGTDRFIRTLRYFDRGYYERLWHCRISSYRPYYHNGSLGWYIVANLINYFLYPDGRLVRLSAAPCYYAYHYDVAHRHRLNFYNWHFWKYHRRPHYSAPVHRSRPVYSRSYRPAPSRNVYRSKSQPVYRESRSVYRDRQPVYRERNNSASRTNRSSFVKTRTSRSEYRAKPQTRSSSASVRQAPRDRGRR